MTELGRRLLEALRGQGFGITFEDGDAVISSLERSGWRHHIPQVLLEDDALEPLLRLAILSLKDKHPEVSLRWLTGRGDPGLN
jgi:hypothetical protein